MDDDRLVPGARYGAVVRALEGVRNPHALLALLGGFLLVGIVVGVGNGLGALTGSLWLAALLNLFGAVLAASVVNAAGLALMDCARGLPERGFGALLGDGARCFVRFLTIGLIALVTYAGFALLAAILLFLCKLPLVGPVLLVVVVPVLVLCAAVLALALFVALSLVAPALWAGHTIKEAVSQLVSIVTHRPLEVLVSLLLLGLLVGAIGTVASVFVFAGSTVVGGLAAGILGGGLGLLGHMDAMGGMDATGASPALAIAGGIGFVMVFALLWGLLAAIQMNGLCHIYLQAREGLEDDLHDLGESIARARAVVGGAGARMADAARQAGDRMRRPSRPAGGSVSPASSATQRPRCPACRAPIGADDRFCGECGAAVDPAQGSGGAS